MFCVLWWICAESRIFARQLLIHEQCWRLAALPVESHIILGESNPLGSDLFSFDETLMQGFLSIGKLLTSSTGRFHRIFFYNSANSFFFCFTLLSWPLMWPDILLILMVVSFCFLLFYYCFSWRENTINTLKINNTDMLNCWFVFYTHSQSSLKFPLCVLQLHLIQFAAPYVQVIFRELV